MKNIYTMYQGQAELLQQQIEGLKATITDITIAKDTLNAINGKDDTETMVPIGAGSFVMDFKHKFTCTTIYYFNLRINSM